MQLMSETLRLSRNATNVLLLVPCYDELFPVVENEAVVVPRPFLTCVVVDLHPMNSLWVYIREIVLHNFDFVGKRETERET